MGARGPAATPTATLKARGSWRANERSGEVQFPPGEPTCPTWLSKEARAEWKRQVKFLTGAGILAKVDRSILAAYCDAWGEFVELAGAVAAMVMERGYAAAIASGLLNAKGKAAERMSRLAQQFGFSPASRTKVKAPEHGDEESPKEAPKLYKIRG